MLLGRVEADSVKSVLFLPAAIEINWGQLELIVVKYSRIKLVEVGPQRV